MERAVEKIETENRISGGAISGKKFVLAPMATLTHEGLRSLIGKFGGCSEYFAEMIHAPSFLAGGQFEKWYIKPGPELSRIVWQITCGEKGPLAELAGFLDNYGGLGIDINMGCCAPPILKQGAGVAWMTKDISHTLSMVEGVREKVRNLRLSVKLRLGETEDYGKLLGFCRSLVSAGVELITLHPRTIQEKFKHLARRKYVEALARDLQIPVYGNGDVKDAQDAAGFSEVCSGVMIGRKAVQCPWIFKSIRKLFAGNYSREGENNGAVDNTELVNIRETGLDFLRILLTSQPEEFYLTRAKRFFFYFCDNLSFAHYVKMKIQNARSLDQIESLWEEYFTKVPEDETKIF